MTHEARGDALHRWLARAISGGTLLAVTGVAVGLALAAVTGQSLEGGGVGLVDVLRRAGAASVVAGGLLALTLVPMVELMVAAIAFQRRAEHRYGVAASGALLLLLAGLAAALVAAVPGR